MKIILLLAFLGLTLANQKLYNGYKVIQTTPRTASDVKFLEQAFQRDEYDFWVAPRGVNLHVHVMVQPCQEARLLKILDERKMSYKILIDDVEKIISRNNLQVSQNPKTKVLKKFHFEDYHRLGYIYEYIDELINSYPDIASQEVIGPTVEGREMRLVTVTKGVPGTTGVWIDSGIHAREWISPAVGVFLLTQLLKNNQHFLDSFHFYFLPVVNPDGYEFTFTDDRFWRKNRRNHTDYDCFGTDLNRNFPHSAWGGKGTSDNPCSCIYHGSDPTSEIETQNFVNVVHEKLKNDITLFLTLHSYSQMVLAPYGYTRPPVYPPDFDELKRLGDICASGLNAIHGTVFEVDNTVVLMGASAGATDDWAKEIGIKYSYTIELRDTGYYGFALPPEQIIPSGEEMWACLHAMLTDLEQKKKTLS